MNGGERDEDGSLDMGLFGAAGGYAWDVDFSFVDDVGRSLRLAYGDEKNRLAKPQA
jgi:hypothetical protein